MIQVNACDARTPRYGIERRAWEQIVRLALVYQASRGDYDWPGHAPDARESNPRLCFYRHIAPQLQREEACCG